MITKQARAAHKALNRAVDAGDLARQCCAVCGAENGRGRYRKTHGHHADYSRELDVEWLCVYCHRYRHARGPRTMSGPHRHGRRWRIAVRSKMGIRWISHATKDACAAAIERLRAETTNRATLREGRAK